MRKEADEPVGVIISDMLAYYAVESNLHRIRINSHGDSRWKLTADRELRIAVDVDSEGLQLVFIADPPEARVCEAFRQRLERQTGRPTRLQLPAR